MLTSSIFRLLQMPRPAPPKISSAVTGSVWRRSSCATATTTVGTPATRRSARRPPVVSTSSVATTRSASRPCGAATGTRTARTSRTSPWSAAAGGPSPRSRAARWASSSAGAGSVSTWTGSVMGTPTARTNLMKLTVVSRSGWIISVNERASERDLTDEAGVFLMIIKTDPRTQIYQLTRISCFAQHEVTFPQSYEKQRVIMSTYFLIKMNTANVMKQLIDFQPQDIGPYISTYRDVQKHFSLILIPGLSEFMLLPDPAYSELSEAMQMLLSLL